MCPILGEDVVPRWQSTRNRALIDSLYEAVGATGSTRHTSPSDLT